MSGTKTFSDELLTCETCGKTFVFRVSEQRRMYESQGLVTTPTECPLCRQLNKETGEEQGEVKWFNVQKGYGFIRKADGEEIFFHRSSLVSASPWDIFAGQTVRFKEQETVKGPEAIEVEPVD
ncbi:MAG: cold shock domain-containing protein [Anaerolineae bacterium]